MMDWPGTGTYTQATILSIFHLSAPPFPVTHSQSFPRILLLFSILLLDGVLQGAVLWPDSLLLHPIQALAIRCHPVPSHGILSFCSSKPTCPGQQSLLTTAPQPIHRNPPIQIQKGAFLQRNYASTLEPAEIALAINCTNIY